MVAPAWSKIASFRPDAYPSDLWQKRTWAGKNLFTLAFALCVAMLVGGCATFGLPDFPPETRHPPRLPGSLFVVYDPQAVLGFGHTGVILRVPGGRGFVRYDQYASSEVAYDLRLKRGTARFWETVTARLPAIFGFTRELVVRVEGLSLEGLVRPFEYLIPLPEGEFAKEKILAAAEMRFQSAARLEQPTARRYFLLANSCQHFVREVLGAGGPVLDNYFPKHFVADYLERYRATPEAGGESFFSN